MIGSTVSHYRITAKLGEGGMGVVYKAEDTRLERVVALKFLSSNLLDDAGRLRFTGEAQAAARVQHPNICPIYEISEYDGQLFFAMAFIDGTTISEQVKGGSINLHAALDIGIQCYDGLEAAHRQGVIHRDIKSANIAVDATGHAWILDFGVALRQDVDRITLDGRAVGTPAYMSPEQAQGLQVDHRTDIWSMAVVLFEMLAGRRPFHQTTQFNILQAIVNKEAPTVSSLRPGIPQQVEQFLRMALAKNPDERWKSAADASAELRRIRATLSEPTMTLTTGFQASKFPVRKRWWITAALALAAVPAAYFGLHLIPPRTEGLPDEKRLAVLPLAVNASDESLRAMADGVIETLTSKLTQIEEFQGKLMVVPASEIRNRKIDSAEAARRIYGANLVLTGSAHRWTESRIEFTQNLVDTATVRQIASRTFEFDGAKPIAMRDGAVNGTIRLLALKLSPSLAQSMAEGETSTPEAYAAYLKGVGYFYRFDRAGDLDRAIASLSQATQLDPRYPLALSALGTAQWKKAKVNPDKNTANLALQNIQAAIRLDPNLAEARIHLGEYYSDHGRSQEAIAELRQALTAAPENAETYRILGRAYTASGQFSEAETAYKEAVRRKPRDWSGLFSLGLFYSQVGRLDDARAALEAARELTPDNELLYRNLAVLDLKEGKFRDASDRISKTLQFRPNARTFSTLGVAYYYQRLYQEAAAALNHGKDIDSQDYAIWGNLGTVYRHLPGMEKPAKDAFSKAIDLANQSLEVRADDNTYANLAEYWAKLGGGKQQALSAIHHIPQKVRAEYADRIVLAYELIGERKQAVEAVRDLPPAHPTLTYIKSDPDLGALLRDPALGKVR